jgi:hypothetical protein
MDESENERHAMIEDGLEFLKNSRASIDEWGSFITLTHDSNTEGISFEELTKIIAYHVREGYFMWKDLPTTHIVVFMYTIGLGMCPCST